MHRVARLLQGFTAAGMAVGAVHGYSALPVAHCASTSSSEPPSSSSSSRRPRRVQELALTDKVVLITGASAGIGRACVWRFAEAGCRLVLVARRADKLLELQADLVAEFPGLRVHVVPMSVTDVEAVAALPTSLPEAFRDVYCLVNNAGLALGVHAVDQNVVVDAKTMLDANVLGTIAFCSAFIPGMKARGAGHVVNMGSCAGKYAYPNGTVYNATKVQCVCVCVGGGGGTWVGASGHAAVRGASDVFPTPSQPLPDPFPTPSRPFPTVRGARVHRGGPPRPGSDARPRHPHRPGPGRRHGILSRAAGRRWKVRACEAWFLV